MMQLTAAMRLPADGFMSGRCLSKNPIDFWTKLSQPKRTWKNKSRTALSDDRFCPFFAVVSPAEAGRRLLQYQDNHYTNGTRPTTITERKNS
jgi:hypothetical protein